VTKYFEDFQVGDVLESRGRTITEGDIMNFAGLTGDFTELHTNAEFAANGPFGQRIAHGLLVLSVATGLVIQMNLLTDSIIAFYGIEKLRFTKPVLIGDTVHVTKKVSELLERGAGRGVVTFATTVLNQRNEPVLVYSDKLVIKRR
jgi:acyl dehydratase